MEKTRDLYVTESNYATTLLIDTEGAIIPIPDVIKAQEEYKEFEKNADETQKDMIEYSWSRLYKGEILKMLLDKDFKAVEDKNEREEIIQSYLEKEGFEHSRQAIEDTFAELSEKENEVYADRFAVTEMVIDKEDLSFLPEGFDFDGVKSIAVLSVLTDVFKTRKNS